MEPKHMSEARFRRKSQRGMTLVELMIAMSILAIGLGALTNLLVVAMAFGQQEQQRYFRDVARTDGHRAN